MNNIRIRFADKEPNKSFVIVLLIVCMLIPFMKYYFAELKKVVDYHSPTSLWNQKAV